MSIAPAQENGFITNKTRAIPVAQYTPVCLDNGGITFKFRKEEHSFLCPTHRPD